MSNKLKKQWEDPEFRNLVTELSRERLTEQWEDPDFRSIVSNAMIITSDDAIVRAKIHRSRFISETPSTSKCYFYVTRSVYEDKSGLIKFGITSQDPKKYSCIKGYTNFHILATVDKDYIANIEYSIKVTLESGEWLPESELSELFKLIKLFIKDGETIKN